MEMFVGWLVKYCHYAAQKLLFCHYEQPCACQFGLKPAEVAWWYAV